MNQRLEAINWSSGDSSSRFEFAPPRHFLLPAIVLLAFAQRFIAVGQLNGAVK